MGGRAGCRDDRDHEDEREHVRAEGVDHDQPAERADGTGGEHDRREHNSGGGADGEAGECERACSPSLAEHGADAAQRWPADREEHEELVHPRRFRS